MKEIAMYLDFKTDESYTPNKISVRAGNNLQDLKVTNCIFLCCSTHSGGFIH